MLRRALLSLCLAAPLAAQAQTMTITPSRVFGLPDCQTDRTDYKDPAISLGWTVVPTGTSFATNDVFRISATKLSTCPGVTDDAGLIDSITATTASGTYPITGKTLTLGSILTASGTTCTSGNADVDVKICVVLKRASGSADGTAQNTLTMQFKPPLAVRNLSVAPGNNALNISWDAPDSTANPAAALYQITVDSTDARDPDPKNFEQGGNSLRVSPLVNGVKYTVTVVALSEGRNPSPPVSKVDVEPVPVDDFFTNYGKLGGAEQGGCAGGPAGLLSLLGLAAVLRATRRRS